MTQNGRLRVEILETIAESLDLEPEELTEDRMLDSYHPDNLLELVECVEDAYGVNFPEGYSPQRSAGEFIDEVMDLRSD
ncbi:MAG: hypothetical protein ABIH92_03465 [Nanoarchaeota archaeon]